MRSNHGSQFANAKKKLSDNERVWFALAETVGEPSIQKLKMSISAQDFLDWQTYFATERTFREFLNLCQANICAFVRHAFIGKEVEPFQAFLIDVDSIRQKDDDELSEELQKKANRASSAMRNVFSGIVAKQKVTSNE